MTEVVLGADVGTSGLKLVALAADGAVVAEAESAYEPDAPRPGWAQSDVGTWRRALDDALAQAAPALAGVRVRALGLSGQMHGAALVDDGGRPLGPALLWPDERAAEEVARWRALRAADRAALANPLAAGMTGPFAAWLARHEPDLLDRAAALLLPKDALRALLVPDADPRTTDRSDASATLLWDVVADGWSAAAVGAAGIPEALLPTVRPATEVVGVARLPVGEVPVVVGGADTPLALLAAAGSDAPGDQVNLGTGAQVLRPGALPAPADDPPVHTYADTEGGWYAMAALRNGGSAWSWVCRVLGLSWSEFFEAAAATAAGGVEFRPYLAGERSRPGAGERGSFRNLQAGTTRAELARAAVEGVLLAVGDAAASLPGAGEGPVLLTGGGARPAVVRHLLADVLGRPVRPLPLRSASAVGAALLAARGAGLDVGRPERLPCVEPGRPGHRSPRRRIEPPERGDPPSWHR